MNSALLHLKKWFLLIILALACCLFYFSDLHHYLNLHTIHLYRSHIEQWTANHYPSAVGIYILSLTTLVACGIPCGTILTILGGLLFGLIAVLYAIMGTTCGGLILFFAVRTSLGAHIASKSRGWIKSMEHGFQRNAFTYLLMLRIVPVFPCGVSNIAAGALNVRVKTYVTATTLGILPATIIYVMLGRGLDEILGENNLNAAIMLSPSMLLTLVGLALLSLSPIIYKAVKK